MDVLFILRIHGSILFFKNQYVFITIYKNIRIFIVSYVNFKFYSSYHYELYIIVQNLTLKINA